MKIRRTACVLATVSGLSLSGAAIAQQQTGQTGQQYGQQYGQQGQQQYDQQQYGQGQQQFGQQGFGGGQGQGQGQGTGWIMQTEQIRSQLQQGLRAYNNNLDDTSAQIVMQAAE